MPDYEKNWPGVGTLDVKQKRRTSNFGRVARVKGRYILYYDPFPKRSLSRKADPLSQQRKTDVPLHHRSPDDSAKPILDAIANATKSIRIKMFIFSDPSLWAKLPE